MIRVRPILLASAFASALGVAAPSLADPQPPPPPAPVVHKHIGQVKYEDMAQSGTVAGAATMETAQIQAVDLSLADSDAGTVYSADPMEGGQIAHYRPGRQKAGKVTAVTPEMKDGTTVYSADPMEGGQVTARTYQPGRPTYGNATFEASSVAKTKTAKFKTLMGACTNGVHIKEATITTRTGSVTLHDATVTSVTPADPVDGQPMEEVTITYASADQ